MGGRIATRYMSRHDEAYVEKLALLAAASPCLTEKLDFPKGLEEELDPLIEGARTDRPAMNPEFGEMLFHTDQIEELMDWLWRLGMDGLFRRRLHPPRRSVMPICDRTWWILPFPLVSTTVSRGYAVRNHCCGTGRWHCERRGNPV